MPAPTNDSLIQECPACGALLDVSGEEPFAQMHCPTCGGAMRVRRRFDHFEIQELLGAGGMGKVYRALDTNLNRPVALKLLQREHSENPKFVAQFQKEAAITASIQHPHVVKVYSTGRDHGWVYIAMELVDHGSLESLMEAQGKVAELQVLTIGVQIAQGLQAALERGLIHRDIKPGNILFADPATSKMVDFGLAVLAEHAGTVAGEVWATPFYVAPETVEGEPEDFRSDMYSLGATLFHALAGQPPHDVESNSMSELARAKRVPVSLQAVAPEVSSTTAFVLNKVLKHDPRERHQTYAELIEHLEFARTELRAAFVESEQKRVVEEAAAARDWSWLTPLAATVVVALGVTAHLLRDRFFSPPPPAAVAAAVLAAQERIDVRYEAARQLLVAGEAAKAADAFTELEAKPATPQPLRNWITLHAGLAALIADREEAARAHFAAIEERGIYSLDPAEQPLAHFFVNTARQAGGTQKLTPEAIRELDRATYEALAIFVFAVRDWSLGHPDEAWQLFRQFTLSTPQDRDAWVAAYKPLASPYLVEINAFRGALETAQAAGTIEARQRALALVRETRGQLKLASGFGARLEAVAGELELKISAEEEEAARRMSATETADARALAALQEKLAALCAEWRCADAVAAVQALVVTGEKGGRERAALLKKMAWLAKFKATLIADLNTTGYAPAVLKKTGSQVPGPVRRASETQIESVTPFGSLPTRWAELAPESVLAMGKSFQRAGAPADALAERQWLLGVYAMQAGRQREGRELLLAASQAREDFREALNLFLESTDAR